MPAPAREDEARDRVGTAHRGTETDEAPERMAHPRRGHRVFGVGHGEHRIGIRIDVLGLLERRGASVPGELGHDHTPLPRQLRSNETPVRGHPAQSVDEHDRRPGAAHEVPEAVQAPLLEGTPGSFGLHPHQGIFFW